MARFVKPDELKRRIQACLSELSPDEFPVHCPKCDYLLIKRHRGTCPECGQRYGRVGLLTSQYDPWRLDARKHGAEISGKARRVRRLAHLLLLLLLIANSGLDLLFVPSKATLVQNANQAIAQLSTGRRLQFVALLTIGPVCAVAYIVSAAMYSRWKLTLVLDRRRLLAKLDEIEARRHAARSKVNPGAAPASERELSASDTSPS